MSKTEMKPLLENQVDDLSHLIDPAIQKRATENLAKADDELAKMNLVRLKLMM